MRLKIMERPSWLGCGVIDGAVLLWKIRSSEVHSEYIVAKRRLLAVMASAVLAVTFLIYTGIRRTIESSSELEFELSGASIPRHWLVQKAVRIALPFVMMVVYAHTNPRGVVHPNWFVRTFDPITFAAAHVSLSFYLVGLSFAVKTELSFQIVYHAIYLVLLPLSFFLAIWLQALRLPTRAEEDTSAVIAWCKGLLEKRAWYSVHRIPNHTKAAVKIFSSGAFLVALSLKMGRPAAVDHSVLYTLSLPIGVGPIFLWCRQNRFYLTVLIILIYTLLLFGFVLLRVVHLPRRVLSSLVNSWRLLYKILLIPAMSHVLGGLRCEEVVSSSDEVTLVLVIDHTVHCDQSYSHREHLVVGLGGLWLTIIAPAVFVLTLNLNRLTMSLPMSMPTPILFRLSIFYSLVACDVYIADRSARVISGGVLCFSLLLGHVINQPMVGKSAVANNLTASVYSVALFGFLISGLRILMPEHEELLIKVFAGSSVLVGALVYFTNNLRARKFDCGHVVTAVLQACNSESDDNVPPEVLAMVYACSMPHVERCKQAIDIKRVRDAYFQYDAESLQTRKDCQRRVDQLSLLALTETGCRCMRKLGLIHAVLELLPLERMRCLEVLRALLSHAGAETLMRSEIRKAQGVRKLLIAWSQWSREMPQSTPIELDAPKGREPTASDRLFHLLREESRVVSDTAHLFNLLRILKDTSEHFIIVHGEEARLSEMQVLRSTHNWYCLPDHTTIGAAVDFLVYMVNWKLWLQPNRVKLLATELKRLANEMYLVAPMSSVVVCTMLDPWGLHSDGTSSGSSPLRTHGSAEMPPARVPQGFPYYLGEERSLQSVDVGMIHIEHCDDPLRQIVVHLEHVVQLSDAHAQVSTQGSTASHKSRISLSVASQDAVKRRMTIEAQDSKQQKQKRWSFVDANAGATQKQKRWSIMGKIVPAMEFTELSTSPSSAAEITVQMRDSEVP